MTFQDTVSAALATAAQRGPDSPDDGSLLHGIARRDPRSLAELQKRHHARLWGYIARRVGDRQLAEEVEQDVWLAVWQQAGRYRGDSRVSTWLLGIAHHKAMSALRRRWPQPVDAVPDQPADPGWQPEARLDARETRAALAAAIGRLSPLHRATLDLVLGHGLSLEETARVMGCPVGTVKSRLSYARKYLARDLALGR
ncbi:MAG: RNA polymerase sigma factor [Bacillota bacterium]